MFLRFTYFTQGKEKYMNSFSNVVEKVKDYCKSDPGISSVGYDMWIKTLQPYKLEDGTAIMYADSDFSAKTAYSQYGDILKIAFEEILGFAVDVKILVKPGEESEAKNKEITAAEERIMNESGGKELTFDNFVKGKSNELAYAFCTAVSDLDNNENKDVFNPLFIYGNSGLGKTHLIKAIENKVHKLYPDVNLIYITGEQFTNEYIKAVTNKETAAFHDKFRNADFLLMDDVQFIAGKDSTQEEFFYTFNEIYNRGKQIVLTSDIPPSKITKLMDRLHSRFVTGMQVDIQPPDFETRIAILNKKAQDLGMTLSEPVTRIIAEKLKTNIRQLEGAVKKIKALTVFTSESPSISMAQRVVKEIQIDNHPAEITVDRIISEISVAFGVSPEDIRSKNRSAPISLARKVTIYILREVKGMTFLEIGSELNRDHSTMTTGFKDVVAMMKKNNDLNDTVRDIIKNLKMS